MAFILSSVSSSVKLEECFPTSLGFAPLGKWAVLSLRCIYWKISQHSIHSSSLAKVTKKDSLTLYFKCSFDMRNATLTMKMQEKQSKLQCFCLICCLLLEVLNALWQRLNHYPLLMDKETKADRSHLSHNSTYWSSNRKSKPSPCLLTLKPNLIEGYVKGCFNFAKASQLRLQFSRTLGTQALAQLKGSEVEVPPK